MLVFDCSLYQNSPLSATQVCTRCYGVDQYWRSLSVAHWRGSTVVSTTVPTREMTYGKNQEGFVLASGFEPRVTLFLTTCSTTRAHPSFSTSSLQHSQTSSGSYSTSRQPPLKAMQERTPLSPPSPENGTTLQKRRRIGLSMSRGKT